MATKGNHIQRTGEQLEGLQQLDRQKTLPEGGWGWVIVASIFCITIVIQKALGVFFVEWKVYFDASATSISWVVSLPPAVMGILSPIAGGLCRKFGSRKTVLVGSALNCLGYLLGCFAQTVVHLYICLGLIAASGTALIFTPALVMLGHYFRERYVLANSIALCGFSVSQMLIPRLAQYLIEAYGWRGAMLILVAIGAHTFPCALLLRPRRRTPVSVLPSERKSSKNSHENPVFKLDESNDMYTSTTSLHLFDNPKYQVTRNDKNHDVRKSPASPILELFKSISFITLLFGSFCAGVGFFVTVAHLVARAVHAGISRNDSAFLMTCVGIGSLIGRGGHGVLIDRGLVSRDVVFIGSFIICALVTFLNPLMDTFSTLSVFGVIFGVSNGVVSTLMFAFIRLQVTAIQAPLALAFGTLVFAVSGMAGGVLAGLLFDITGNYDVSFCFAGVMLTIGSLFVLSNILLMRRKEAARLSR